MSGLGELSHMALDPGLRESSCSGDPVAKLPQACPHSLQPWGSVASGSRAAQPGLEPQPLESNLSGQGGRTRKQGRRGRLRDPWNLRLPRSTASGGRNHSPITPTNHERTGGSWPEAPGWRTPFRNPSGHHVTATGPSAHPGDRPATCCRAPGKAWGVATAMAL